MRRHNPEIREIGAPFFEPHTARSEPVFQSSSESSSAHFARKYLTTLIALSAKTIGLMTVYRRRLVLNPRGINPLMSEM